ncbi:MAG: HEAT repeat domain-containing protein [Leptolyngbyaceae cyanobacterium RM1_406_9]|nr:HEAT repeat domain-containing protein [Leptolyngbyaceae cyanobacterium RM1_406_9]
MRLALSVDLKLGAELVRNINLDFQEQAIRFVLTQANEKGVSQLSKTILLSETHSQFSIPFLSKMLGCKDYFVHLYALHGLGKVGSEDAVNLLIQELNEDKKFSKYAARGLGKTNSDAVIPYLTEALNSNDIYISQNAAYALGEIGSQAAIMALIQSLVHKDEVIRSNVVSALGNLPIFGKNSEAVISHLERILLHDESPFVRRSSLIGLKNIFGHSVVRYLEEALRDEDSLVRSEAAYILGEVASESEISLLIKLAKDEDLSVRAKAVTGLAKIKNPIAIPILINLLNDPYFPVCERAAFALGEFSAEEAISPLAELLKEHNSDLRRSAAYALKKIKHRAARLHLQNCVNDNDPLVRWTAIETLREIKDDSFLFDIKYVLNYCSDEFVRARAVFTLVDNFNGEAVVEILVALLSCEISIVRSSSAKALGETGSEAAKKALLNALKDGLSGNDIGYFMSIIDALQKLDACGLMSNFQQVYWCSEARMRFHMEQQLRTAITTIQNHCKYYNHEIWQEAVQSQEQAHSTRQTTQPSHSEVIARIDRTTQQIDQRTRQMISEPKSNFSGATFNAPVNFGDNPTGAFIGTQNNYPTDPELQCAIADLQTLLTQLQIQHPQVTTEIEAIAITDAKFTEIKQSQTHGLANLRKQLLNPERHLQATKATLGEVAKHYLEESVWAKAILTYLDKLSEDPNLGA